MPGNTFHLNDIHAAQQNFQLKIKSAVIPDFIVVLTQVRSLPCLVAKSSSLLLTNFVQIGFIKVVRWICQN